MKGSCGVREGSTRTGAQWRRWRRSQRLRLERLSTQSSAVLGLGWHIQDAADSAPSTRERHHPGQRRGARPHCGGLEAGGAPPRAPQLLLRGPHGGPGRAPPRLGAVRPLRRTCCRAVGLASTRDAPVTPGMSPSSQAVHSRTSVTRTQHYFLGSPAGVSPMDV